MLNYPAQLMCTGLEPDMSLALMPSGPAAFFALIFLSSFLTWAVVKDRLEQGGWVLGVNGLELPSNEPVGGGWELKIVEGVSVREEGAACW